MKKKDCFYYFEHQEMGSSTPCCTNNYGLGNCPCEKCNDYISKSDSHKIIRKIQKKELVDVVRCKDCKYWKQYESYQFGECEIYKGYNRSGNWFCAEGKRKK